MIIIDNFSEYNNNNSTDMKEVSNHMTEISARSSGQNSFDDSKEVSLNNSLETVNDYYKILLKEYVKDCEYFDKEIDSTSQSVKEMNEEVALQSREESNKSKSDNENDSSNKKKCQIIQMMIDMIDIINMVNVIENITVVTEDMKGKPPQ